MEEKIEIIVVGNKQSSIKIKIKEVKKQIIIGVENKTPLIIVKAEEYLL